MGEYKLLIGGRLVDGDMTMPVVNPATGQVFAEAPVRHLLSCMRR